MRIKYTHPSNKNLKGAKDRTSRLDGRDLSVGEKKKSRDTGDTKKSR